MPDLTGLRVAVIATDGFEEAELTEPVKALKEAGARPEVISLKPGKIQAFKHQDKSTQVDVDRTLDEAGPNEYDAVVLPGGALNAAGRHAPGPRKCGCRSVWICSRRTPPRASAHGRRSSRGLSMPRS